MNKLINTIKNIWNIEELRNKILFTMACLAFFRLGSFIVLPGVIPSVLENSAKSNSNDLLGLVNVFTGGAFSNASVFALGIMPYITASIIVQLLGFAVPYFQRLQTKEGESGRKQLNQITRFLTVAITLVQSGAYLTYVRSLGAVDQTLPAGVFWFSNIIVLTTGTILAMWLGEKINDRGIGNGVSVIIMIGILSRLPAAFVSELQLQIGNNGLILFVLEIALLFFVIMFNVLIVQGVRRIPVQYAKRMVGRTADATLGMGSDRESIPIKVNAAGVMPIIFAQALMFIPATAIQFLSGSKAAPSAIMNALNDFTSIPYNVIYFILIVLFTYVYTALIINPTQYAEYLKRQNAFIPGIKPGESTAEYIDAVTTRITFPGSVFLAIIAILPAIVTAMGVNRGFALFFGGTSLLIAVGVTLDTLQQVESHLLMRKYDGLIKSGRVKGRSNTMIESNTK
ncbi:MAG: preprotein translocase subunit SecY [Saprospiraceae bacterium]|nr:preprotein translocase subunit SecY [Saprospiraceae bacterium]